MEVDGQILVLDDDGVVRELGAAQPLDAEVLLAVDEREALGQVAGEEAVDDGEGAVVLRVGLLDMGVERVVVHGRAVGEGHHAVAHIDAAARHAQLGEVGESPLHGPLLGAELRGVSLVHLPPLAFELHAGLEPVGRELLVAVVGVFGRETVDVVAFGLVAAPRQVAQVVGRIDVVLQCTVRLEGELPDVHVANHVAPLVREPDDAQPLPVGMSILAQRGDDAGAVALADGLHVAQPLAAVNLEANHQKAVHHGPCAVVDLLPAVHVREREVAVGDVGRHREAFDGCPVFEPDGLKFNHRYEACCPRRPCSPCVRCGCSIVE